VCSGLFSTRGLNRTRRYWPILHICKARLSYEAGHCRIRRDAAFFSGNSRDILHWYLLSQQAFLSKMSFPLCSALTTLQTQICCSQSRKLGRGEGTAFMVPDNITVFLRAPSLQWWVSRFCFTAYCGQLRRG
jgi:hypothetical protein